jgi:glycosyltransferase involved in cell wall biosynthesis
MDNYVFIKPSIDVYVVCYNEIKIIPFIVDYWKTYARHVYVYDNGSTDGSVEYLKQFDWISVFYFESDGFNDERNAYIKNNMWKGSDADWVFVCDMDEVLFSPFLFRRLNTLRDSGCTIVKPWHIDIIGDTGIPKYRKGVYLHQMMKGGILNRPASRMLLFRPDKIKEMNYTAGCHGCYPKGEIGIYDDDGIYYLHLKDLGIDYVLERYKMYRERMSETNKKMKYGIHYYWSPEEITERHNDAFRRARPIEELIT